MWLPWRLPWAGTCCARILGCGVSPNTSYVLIFLRVLSVVIFCLGIIAGVIVYISLQQNQQTALQVAFEREGASLGAGVTGRVSCFMKTAQTLSATMTLQPNMSRHEFASLIQLGTTLVDGIYGISWIVRVRHADRAAFETAARAEEPGFNITPSDVQPEYMVVYLIEPKAQNQAAIGFNLFSNVNRKVPMELARDRGTPVVTSRIRLVQEQEEQVWGVLYTIAVYNTLRPPADLTLQERRQLHIGYVNGVIRVKSLVKDTKDYAAEEFVEWFMFDANATQSGNYNESLLYTSGNAKVQTPEDVTSDELPVLKETLDIGTRQWVLIMRPRDTLVVKHQTAMPIIWMLTIFIVDLLLCAGVMLIANKVRLDAELRQERTRLLDRLLPKHVSEHLMNRRVSLVAETQPACCVLFIDVAGFTTFSAMVPAPTVLDFLRLLFAAIDEHCNAFHIEKIKTIGDSYMAANGLFGTATLEENATQMLKCALLINDKCLHILERHGLSMRSGVHGGEAICGVLGGIKPYFDIWGDTVNMASRMESTGIPGKVQITTAIHDLLRTGHPEFVFTPRAEMVVLKGKGPTKTWFVSSMGQNPKNAEQTPTPRLTWV